MDALVPLGNSSDRTVSWTVKCDNFVFDVCEFGEDTADKPAESDHRPESAALYILQADDGCYMVRWDKQQFDLP